MNHQVNIDDHVEAMENMALFHGVDPSKRQRTSSPQTSSRSAGVEDAIIPLNSDPRSKKPHTIYTHPFFIPKVRPSREEPPLQSMLFAKQNSGGSPLVRISQNQWIDIDTAYQNEIAQRLAFFRKNKGQVFCAFEGRAALEELYQELIIRLLPARYPTIFRKLRNENVVSSSQSGAACGEMPAYSGGMDPKKLLNMIASNITEDVYVFAKDAKGVYRLSAAISAYPNGFSVSERDRKSLDEFARANLKFANQAGAEQLKNLRLGEYFSRMTWDLYHSTMPLNQPKPYGLPDTFNLEPNNSSLRIRAEHQVFTRLSISQAIVLTTKTYTVSIEELIASGHGPDLSAAIRRLPERFNLRAKWVRSLRSWLDAPREAKRRSNGEVVMVDRPLAEGAGSPAKGKKRARK